MEGQPQIVTVNSLHLEGGGSVSIDIDGNVVTAEDVEVKGSTLICKGSGGSSSVMITDGSVFNTFGSTGQISMNGMNISTNGSIVSIKTRNGRLIEIDDRTGSVKVDGNSVEGGKKLKETPRKLYRISENSVISTIQVKGASDLRVIPSKFLSDNLIVSISGSGDVNLPSGKTFETLTASIAGSGDIIGKSTKVKSAMFSITGSGDITGFHIISGGSCSVLGSGDIKCSKEPGANVAKNCMGSGKISIK